MSEQRIDFYAIGYHDGCRGIGVDVTLREVMRALGRELTESEREEIDRGYYDGVGDALAYDGCDDE